jgi:uncharacterized protein YeaO (DUF488 family)
MRLTTFRIGDAAKPNEGLRIGTTRRPPRGVAKERWRKDGYFDVWFPLVAPSEALLARAHNSDLSSAKAWETFAKAYRRELQQPPAKYALALLAAIAERTPIAVGCFCENESRCHRSVLRDELLKQSRPA